MKRRNFIGQASAAATFMSLGAFSLDSCGYSGKKHITILHTNDVHSHIDPFPTTHARFPNLGGIVKRAQLIEKIRAENPNTLLLDAGDIFQGTPYFNFYGGELEFKLMSKLGYDAATIGNHDFDNGIDGLLAQMPHAEFKLLSANYDFSNTVMNGYVDAFNIFEIDQIKIGVFGLGIQLEGLVTRNLYKETKYLDPKEITQDMGRILKEEKKCDLVICLSHLGYEYRNYPQRPSDVKIGSETEHIDLIIGGHTHTFLEKPEVRRNKVGKKVIINQVGCYGVNLGRIDFYFDEQGKADQSGLQITV